MNKHNLANDMSLSKLHKYAVWPPGSADTVCPRPPLILTFDHLSLKLVYESHLK